jgi:hypothetical protein
MDLVLDTNAFYYYYDLVKNGVSTNEMILPEKVISCFVNNKLFISSYSVYEIITKYLNNPQLIREYFLFLKEKAFGLIATSNLSINPSIMNDLSSLTNSKLKARLHRFRKEKVELESQYILVFFLSLFNQLMRLITLDISIDCQMKFYGPYIKKRKVRLKGDFKRELYKGYDKGDVDKLIKVKFDSLLRHELKLGVLLANLSCSNIIIKTQDEFDEAVNTCDIVSLPNRYNENINRFIAKESLYFAVKSKTKIDELFADFYEQLGNSGFHTIQIGFINDLMQKWGIRGAKFSKNDIFDMLIVSTLSDEKLALITFDKNLIEYLEEINHISVRFIKRIYRNPL